MDKSCKESDRQQRKPVSCGRYIFRDADLAYLLINEERMFPLAELLASLFNNTARTTLFTRMEKINTRRHFCNAEEIRLLKTVNGIHGSSAICTLIPEPDVQKYCEVFIDRIVDLKVFSRRRRKAKRNDSCKSEDIKQDKGGNDLTTEEGNHTISAMTDVESDKATLKRKRATTHNKHKTKLSREGKNTRESNHSQLLDDSCKSKVNQDSDSRTALASHVLQGTQTNQVVIRRKKRKAKEQECLTKDDQRQRKKAKISKAPENKPRKKHGNSDANDSCLADNSSNSCAGNLEQCSSSSLSQCLANASSEILFSDASSNDSGFASTTTSESAITSNPSARLEANPSKKPHDNFCSLPSPSKHNKNKKLKKGKEDSKLHDQSLSPPALVIKRQNNTWQVETKSNEKETDSRNIKTIPSKVKKRLKWPSSSSVSQQQRKKKQTSSFTVKKKKKRKITISDKDELEVHSEGRHATNRKLKCAKVNQRSNTDSVQVNINNSTIKNSGLSKNCTSATKRGKNSKEQGKQVTNSTNNRLTPKKVTVRAKALRANQNFKLMNLFSSFPMLSFKDGDLGPTYSEILPEKSEKLAKSHPIWKWQRGRPVYIPENKKTHRHRIR